MPTIAPRSPARLIARALLLGVLLTAITTWGPAFAAWCRPRLLGKPTYSRFSHQNRDFDTTDQSNRLGWIGYQRLEAIAMRGTGPINPRSTAPRDVTLAEQVIEADVRLLGPMNDGVFTRPGLIFHRHRAGFPFSFAQSSICLVWRNGGSYEGLTGGTQIEQPFPGTPKDGLVWLFPWGVRPWGLLGNLACWTLIAGVPSWVRAGISSARRRAGRCTSCGYDKRGIPDGPCPECGAAP